MPELFEPANQVALDLLAMQRLQILGAQLEVSCVLPYGVTFVGTSGVPTKLSRGLAQPHRQLRPQLSELSL